MKIRSIYLKTLAGLLALTMMMTPGMVTIVFAQNVSQATPQAEAASDDEIQTIQQLANAGYLGDKKDYYLSNKTLTEDDITDGILKAKDYVTAADIKTIRSAKIFQVSDLQTLLDLVKDKEEDIKARKNSAWKLENRLQKMIAALLVTPAPDSTPGAEPTETNAAVSAVSTATPLPGPSRQDFNGLKDSFKTLDDKLSALQSAFDKRGETLQAIQKDNDDLKVSEAGNQEQLKLVKKLLDRVQEDIKKSEDHMNEVEKKVDQKMVTDTEMQQEITVMHKDLRDDTEDISVLKEEVAKLDKTDHGSHNALDDFLSSKWLSGGALIVGLTALTISLTRH
jgi:DNA repair exonuclease SbcCD ATPase subunit